MKRILAVLLALCLLPCCLAEETEGSGYPPIHIALWGNPSSGYEWTCEYDDNGVLTAPMEEFVADEPQEGQLNAGGTYNYHFGVSSPGEAQILFNYGVTWGVDIPERSVICSVKVAEDGKNEIRWAETYSGDKMMLVILPTNPTTGWTWDYAGDSAGIVTLVDEQYDVTYQNLGGAGGNTSFTLQVNQPGETVLLFNYANMWDPQAAAEETYAITLFVSEDMELSMSIDEY